ncbi:AraC family transcriptional regulator [Massilia antarctica]|uniref:AraC family transcriptional regulator n=1 Tax=Massilia antarctica TaxID=2765360 RepID=UPI0006BB8446|nr:helix-turn-helix transcriptional regulator [Massilia sp. H27-R4]MCY0911244.1 helix-turn-helix transcriptional regulator [Massilia sp. H27-R4]CUI05161.1 Transcriptional regulator, AraC family [Janthinobacterium sp. CG23_2]CUU28947.1 Transcriptional regulator, AraC family [Janthinobacterium sp. CG23_2]
MSDLSLDPAAINTSEGPVVIVAAGSQDSERASSGHRHARGQLMGSLRGLLSVGVADGQWIVPAIHAVWLPPHHFHAVRSHGPFAGWSAYVAEPACAGLPLRPCTIRTSGLLREAVLRAATWALEPLDAQRERIAQVILDEIRHAPPAPFGLPLPRDPRLQRVARALVDDPADERDLEQWAQWAAVSSRTLTRRFAAETGFGFVAWRQRARLMRALEMLAADKPVTTVAMDLGYASASAFIKLFTREFGATPAAYRRALPAH